MNLKEVFEKQGGFGLIRQYARAGSLGTAIGEFFLLGKSRTALEILRLSTQLKLKQKLEKEYKAEVDRLDRIYDASLPHTSSNKVWVCWFQGMENAPEIVKRCFNSVKENIEGREIVLITSDNMMDYVTFPDEIQKKIESGIIKGAHLSDLLRLELLLNYGGTWMDSTVFCSGKNIPEYMMTSDLFMFQCMKPGRDGHCTVVSNWFITAKTNNKLLWMVKELLYSYWKEHDKLDDYFIFHAFFQICIEKCPQEWNKVIPVSNSTPHILLLRLNEEFDQTIWDAVTQMMPFHKLSYKLEKSTNTSTKTFLDHIMKYDE